MQVASVVTSEPTMRSEIEGWTYEDSSLFVARSYPNDIFKRIFIGYTPSPKNIPHYTSILQMLADGWMLLAPPQRETYETKDGNETQIIVQWGWWLTRDKKEG